MAIIKFKMKRRISLVATIVLCSLFTQAQETETTMKTSGGTTFGIRGGVNFQTIAGKDQNDDKFTNDLLVGYAAGVTVDIPMAPDFYIQSGLLFATKGAKKTDVIGGQDYTTTTKISYVELPVNLLYKPMLGSGHLLLGFGPYVALGVGGKVKYKGTGVDQTENIKFENEVKLTDPNDVTYFKPVDVGANMLAGYEFSNKLSFQLNAQLGLVKINPKYEGSLNDKTSAKNVGFGFSLGYKF